MRMWESLRTHQHRTVNIQQSEPRKLKSSQAFFFTQKHERSLLSVLFYTAEHSNNGLFPEV